MQQMQQQMNNNQNSNGKQIFIIKKVQKNNKIRSARSKKKRKFNKDCILKKIKSRFFKYFINKHVGNFANFINRTREFNDRIKFQRLDDYFVKDVTIKRNFEWNFINKNCLELFNDYSKMNLQNVYMLYKEDPIKFKSLLSGLDPATEFIMVQSFSIVFNTLMSSKKNFDFFVEKVRIDLEKKNTDLNTKDYYFVLFKENVANFSKYYTNYI